MGNKESKSACKSKITLDESELLTHGFLREMHETASPPNDICQLCYQFYFISKLIFINNYAAFHALDVTLPNNPQFNKNIIELHSFNSNANQKYFDISCHIPDLSDSINSSKLKQLLNINNIKPNTKYDGILTRKIAYNKTSVYNMLYVFESANISTNDNTKTNDHYVLQSSSPNTNHLLFDNWFYCGPYWGIIAVIGMDIYRLKLQDIDAQLTFIQQIATHDHSKWIMKYLDGKDALFAVAKVLSYTYTIYDLQFTIYDLYENKWTHIQPIKCESEYTQQKQLKWKWNLSHNENKMFLVSEIGDVIKYNFVKNRWNYVYETNPNDSDFHFTNEPIVWSYDQCPDLLYCAGTANKEVLQLRCLDMRRTRKQWVKCFDNLWIDLPLNNQAWHKFNTFT